MSRSFETPVLSCSQADDGALQRANTGRCLPDMLTQLHKYGDVCTDYTAGTKDKPHLCRHPGAVRVDPAPSGRCSPSPICSIAWPLPVRTSQQAGAQAFTAGSVGGERQPMWGEARKGRLLTTEWMFPAQGARGAILDRRAFLFPGGGISGNPSRWGPGSRMD